MKNFSVALTAALLCSSVSAQQTLTLPAGAEVTVRVTKAVPLDHAKVGDPVEMELKYPLRAGKVMVAPKGTAVHGRLTSIQLKPLALGVELDPVALPDGQVLKLSGNPAETNKKGKLVEVEQKTPKELDWYYRPSAGDIAAITGVGLIALPIVAIASPFILVDALSGDKSPKTINAGHSAVLKTVDSMQVDVEKLPQDMVTYKGQPVIYLVDRLSQHHRRVYCGTDPFWGDKHPNYGMVRMEPGSYTFHTERKSETTATVNAVADRRYLVYHDHAGLHALSVEDRPDLLDGLQPLNDKTKYLFDATQLKPMQQTMVAADRERGGCGIVKMLKERKAPLTKHAETDTLKQP